MKGFVALIALIAFGATLIEYAGASTFPGVLNQQRRSMGLPALDGYFDNALETLAKECSGGFQWSCQMHRRYEAYRSCHVACVDWQQNTCWERCSSEFSTWWPWSKKHEQYDQCMDKCSDDYSICLSKC
jgi:hypothetical protein